MIHYGTPYSLEKRFGHAANQFMRMLPEPRDFGCLVDADAVFTTHFYGTLIQQVVDENSTCRLFYALTNRIGCPWQRDETICGDDMRFHREYGRRLAEMHGSAVREVQGEQVPGSGFLILVRKDLWQEVPFQEQGMLGVDWDFFRRVAQRGERILQMQGLYLYHWYRGGNAADIRHLQ